MRIDIMSNVINPLRNEILQIFKKLHRTRQRIFAGDEKALFAGKVKINQEFKKNKHVSNQESIKEMLKISKEVERELRQSVVQAREVRPNVYELKITEDTFKFENCTFNKDAELPKRRIKTKCSDMNSK